MLKESKANDQRLQILTVIVLPEFNECTILPILIDGSLLNIGKNTAIVVGDSKTKVRYVSYKGISHILAINHKQSRSAAIKQGMKYYAINFPNVTCIIESDSDGSHLVINIVKIINWPLFRRFFYFLLNSMIPKLVVINSTDLTNGLRGYSLGTYEIILSHKNIINGFMKLLRTAKMIFKHVLTIKEIPIKFTNRIAGKSSVTFEELYKSIKDLTYLIKFTGCDQCEF